MRVISNARKLVERQGRRHVVKRGLRGRLHLENLPALIKVFKFLLLITHTRPRGQTNAADVKLERVQFVFDNLPTAFDNTRILLLTDLHINAMDGLAEKISRIAGAIDYDYCILGGDYSFAYNQESSLAHWRMAKLVKQLTARTRVFAVLGNHDRYCMAEVLADCGAEVLINENLCLQNAGDKIYLTGLDDCHYYGADDLETADNGLRDSAFKIILSHSPERYIQAANAGYSLYLAGHTHGGQVCLPGGLALVTAATIPRRLVRGRWRYRAMTGYTSRGIGTSGLQVRFFCPPEITLITLQRAK